MPWALHNFAQRNIGQNLGMSIIKRPWGICPVYEFISEIK